MTKTATRFFLVLCSITAFVTTGRASVAQPADTKAQPLDKVAPAPLPSYHYDEFRMVPVRVHLLRDSETRAAITKLTEQDIARIFKKANGIWHNAGVHLWVESIVTEKPASLVGYEHEAILPYKALLPLRPEDSRSVGMFHVYYLGAIPPNGVYMERDGIFVNEGARLRPVAGGIDEPLPRVTAHELGHAMGLPHRQDTFNLMASGTTGTSLNAAEIAAVRQNLDKLQWVLTPELFVKRTDELAKTDKKAQAMTRYRALVELPGDSAIKKSAEHALSGS